MKISALGIGTELTDGQILNRNGQWISQQMKSLGVSTTSHLVVPDEKNLMLQALQFCAEHSDVIFVTGGLGPTSDDFTRDVVAQWCGLKLIWDEKSWQHIQDRLIPRGIAVKEIQRQQCYFPEHSKVLTNRVGTANAFQFQHQGKEIYVLPGPPKEIEAIWQDFIEPEMKLKTQHLDPVITHSWDTMGLGESDVADLVEAALKNAPVEIGYRVHMPFVEVKITYPRSQEAQAQTWKKSLEKAIGSITILRDGTDAAQSVAEKLIAFPNILVCDSLPGSFLMTRMFPFSKALLKESKLNFLSRLEIPHLSSDLILTLETDSPGNAQASVSYKGQRRVQSFQSPYKSALLKEREFQYFTEMALIFWMNELSS
jgi:nicotinamide-nucleotide amidase